MIVLLVFVIIVEPSTGGAFDLLRTVKGDLNNRVSIHFQFLALFYHNLTSVLSPSVSGECGAKTFCHLVQRFGYVNFVLSVAKPLEKLLLIFAKAAAIDQTAAGERAAKAATPAVT